ncbi:MAG: hypothetical protein WCV70_02120 [Patescibacteria group bacterium]|jgi:hypothetical protein
MFSNKIVIILLSVFLLAGAVFLGFLSWQNIAEKQKPQVSIEANPGYLTEPKNTNIIGVPPARPIEEVKPDGEIEWLAEPVKLEDLKLVDYAADATGMPPIEYYKVANINGGGEIINEFIQPQNPSGKQVIRFKKTSDGKYSLINKNSEFEGNDFKSNVPIDRETDISSLNAPAKILINGINFSEKDWYGKVPLQWDKLIKIGTTASGDFFKKLTAENYNLAAIEYVLKLPDSTAVYYDMPYDFLAADNSLIANFNEENKEFKEKKFSSTIIPGCSGFSAFISEINLANSLYPIGATMSGSILYAPKDTAGELFKAVYDGYKIGREASEPDLLSYEAIVAKKPVVVWRDLLGDYHIFYDSVYSPAAECGKPVIYLYPETKTEIKVQVGAEVRISEPNYGVGWKVAAYPDGKIINSDGAVYENLYWEGKGRGYYPRITEGRIVKQADIEAELRSDLAALGLNEKESADFMDFWLPLMPNTSYIRLTWLDTAEMNNLAPLAISPWPDTVKRVFLDFAGQNTAATDLAPQQLQGFERIGFTVVEWGGLLLGDK